MNDTATLQELIAWLDKCPPSAPVAYSDGTFPGALQSSRGNYAELALGHEPYGAGPAAGLADCLRAAIGKQFDGYKGGTYTMAMSTPIWRDNWGEWTDTAIVGGRMINGAATIMIHEASNRKWEL